MTTDSNKCRGCKGTGVIQGRDIECHDDGTPFSEGPIVSYINCPLCNGTVTVTQEWMRSLTREPQTALEIEMALRLSARSS